MMPRIKTAKATEMAAIKASTAMEVESIVETAAAAAAGRLWWGVGGGGGGLLGKIRPTEPENPARRPSDVSGWIRVDRGRATRSSFPRCAAG